MTPSLFKKIQVQPSSIRDVAYQTLRDAILTAQLPPNERLIEERLAQEFGISRTPLREAIQKLEHDRLVVRLPSGGVAVAGLQEAELKDLYVIRTALEGMAARLAATNITPQELEHLAECNAQVEELVARPDLQTVMQTGMVFHQLIWQASRNQRLIDSLEELMAKINRYRMFSVVWRIQEAMEEHQHIIDALAAGDPDESEKRMRRHIEVACELTIHKLNVADDA